MFADPDRPRLARGVRLRYDSVRDTQMLLRPEGALELNPSAASVLELCDGERTIHDIVRELQARFPGADLGNDVRDLLNELAQVGVVTNAHQ